MTRPVTDSPGPRFCNLATPWKPSQEESSKISTGATLGVVPVYEGYNPRPTAAGPLDRHGEREHLEAMRARELVEVAELLDLAVLALGTELVRLPELPVIARTCLGRHHVHGAIDPPGVDADEPHPLLDQPRRRVAAQAWMHQVVAGRTVVPRHVGADQHDVIVLELVADPVELGLDVVTSDARLPIDVREVQDHAVAHEPAQRDLLDRP